MTLTLVSVEHDYFVYEDGDGDEVLLAGTGPIFRQVVLWEDFDLETAWFRAIQAARAITRWGQPVRATFVEEVRQAVADQDSVDIVWCESCSEAIREDGAESISSGYVCTPCHDEYYRSCDSCGSVVHYDDMRYTLSDESVCDSCASDYGYCEDCDGYYHDSDSGDHRHGGCDCESPAQHFVMRNDGDPLLHQDERVTIALPSGMISDEGIQSIARLVSNHGYNVEDYDERTKWWSLARELEEALGAQWQTREGNYTKRLSKLAHKSHGLKVPADMLSTVGNIGRDNSTGVDFQVEITRNLNLPAEDFYHEDSCWWQSYGESRCALKSNGGIGMRTFSENGYVAGRAWIMPLRADENGRLTPTFDSLTPDAFVIFNGYGDLSGYAPARIVAHMAGMTYRKIEFDCSPMYVNNSSGYLVTSEELADKNTSLRLYSDTHSTLHRDEEARNLIAA